jgi:hypothetical protein
MKMKRYTKPRMTALGLLREVTKFSTGNFGFDIPVNERT